VDFTSIELVITIGITVFNHNAQVVSIDFITKIDLSITIGIGVVHNFTGDVINIITSPFTFTGDDNKWTITIDVSVTFWTVFISPSIFASDNTGVEFTSVNVSILVFVTRSHKDI